MRLPFVVCWLTLVGVSSFQLTGLRSRCGGILLKQSPAKRLLPTTTSGSASRVTSLGAQSQFRSILSNFGHAVPAAGVNLVALNLKSSISKPLRLLHAPKKDLFARLKHWFLEGAYVPTYGIDPSIFFIISKFLQIAFTCWWVRYTWNLEMEEDAISFKNYMQEVDRDKEYRENMYFESVKDIENQLANPQLGKKKKEFLEKQVVDLDPLGQIRSFLAGNASRPVFQDENAVYGTDVKLGAHSRFGKEKIADAPDRSKGHALDGEDANWEGEPEPSIYRIEPDDEQGPAGQIRKMLGKLDLFLEKAQCLTPKRRVALISKLSRSFAEAYDDVEKRNKAIEVVKRKLLDEEYWVRYANKLSKLI